MSDKKKNAELSENEEKKAKKTDSKKSQKSNKDKKNIFKSSVDFLLGENTLVKCLSSSPFHKHIVVGHCVSACL